MATMTGVRKALSIPVAEMPLQDRKRLWVTVVSASLFSLAAIVFGVGLACLLVP